MIERIRPSKLKLASKCPASLIPTDAPQEYSPQAEKGTYLHTFLDKKSDLPETLSTRELWMMESARKQIPDGAEFDRKISLTVGGIDLSGTADACWVEDGRGVVVDLKTGETKVETCGNFQLAAYALGYLIEKNLKFFRVAIIQPHVQQTQWAEGTISALTNAVGGAVEFIKANAPLESCGKWCDDEYCPRKSECVTYRKERAAAVLSVGNNKISESFQQLSPDDQIIVAEKARIAKDYCDSILSDFRKLALSGAFGDRVDVKTVPGNRKISDAQKAFELSGLEVSEIMPLVEIPFSDLRDAIVTKTRSEYKTKKEAEKAAEEKLSSVTERGAEKTIIKIKEKANV